ncbi:MAG TPA: FixH family protein [Daejeonella sp.]|nr:FixH family protein [Daejeonella sp.]
MNWGTKICIGLGLFMSFIITLAVLMMRSSSDDLVESDYYEKGIAYDQDYNRKKQVEEDQAQPKLEIKDHVLQVTFTQPAVGQVRFKHSSDKKFDTQMDFQSQGKLVELPLKDIRSGQWRLIFEWQSNGKNYLFEKEMFISAADHITVK